MASLSGDFNIQEFSDAGAPLASGRLYTYAQGTTTQKTAYTDIAGTIPHTYTSDGLGGLYIALNARGELSAPLYLASGAYDITLKRSDGSTIWTRRADGVSADLASSVGAALVGWSNAGTPVTVEQGLNLLYFGFANVRNTKYAGGAVGDGVTNDTAAFQAAINDVKATGAALIVPYPASFYNITGALDLSVAGQPNLRGISVIGVGGTCQDLPAIKFKHTGVGFDCTGGSGYLFDNLNIGSDAATYPTCAFLFARNNTNGSAGRHRMINCRIVGRFSKANVYSYASEENEYISCCMTNQLAATATKVVCITGNNVLSVSSTFQTIATGSQSNLVHTFHGGDYYNQAGHASSDVFYLDTASAFRLHDAWAYCASATVNGRALIYVDTTNGSSDYCSVIGLTGESSGFLQTEGIYFGDSAATPTGWTIEGCRLPSAAFAIYAHPLVTLDNFQIRGITESASKGLSAAGTVQKSTINSHDMLLVIGTSSHNVLIGKAVQWTITTRTGDYWIDAGTGNVAPSYTAVTLAGAWTNTSGASYNVARYTSDYVNQVRLSGTVTGGVATTTIFTLPAGFRPPKALTLSASCVAGTAVSIFVATDGRVLHNGGSTTDICLDGLTFSTI